MSKSKQNQNNLGMSTLWVLAHYKIKITQTLSVLGVENIEGKCWLPDPLFSSMLHIDLHGLSLSFNSLPNNKILDVTKLKAFADDKIKVAQMLISIFDRIENIVGKGENAGYQHFLFFPQCFQKTSFLGSSKFGIVW